MLPFLLAFGCFWWDAVPDADYYRVCWSADPVEWNSADCAEVEQAILRDDLTDPVIPTPPPGGVHFVRVRACNEVGCGP